MQLNIKAFTITCALFWGFGLFILTWWIIAFDGSSGLPFEPLSSLYRGYIISPLGSFIGFGYGFIDGGLGGLIFSWLYNCLCNKCGCRKSTD